MFSAFAVVMQAMATPPATAADAIERLGVAGLLVLAAIWMIRYFMGLLDKKEDRLTDVTDRFIKSTDGHANVLVEFTQEMHELRLTNTKMTSALDELKGALRRDPR